MGDTGLELLCYLEKFLSETATVSQLTPKHLSQASLLLKNFAAKCYWNLPEYADFNVLECLNASLLCIETAATVLEDRHQFNLKRKHFTRKEEESLDSFAASRKEAIERTIVSEKNKLPVFNDIVGLDDAKRALREALIDPIVYPEWFSLSGLKPWRCVLLYGPPGTGKTHLSRSIAGEVDSRFYEVSSSDLISTWSGQSEKLIRELFDHALAFEGVSIIFIDEVDSLCRIRCSNEDESSRRIKTELLLQLQRLHSSESAAVLICATNCPWDLDAAFLRRFEKKIYVGLPDFKSRRILLKNLLSKVCVENTINWDIFAHSTDGFSGDDLKRLARELAFLQFRKYKENCNRSSGCRIPCDAKVFVSEKEFSNILQNFTPSVDQETLSTFLQYAK